LKRLLCLGAALAAASLAACVDNQAPDSPTPPTNTADPSLPVLGTMQVTGSSANAVGDFKVELRFINPPTAAQEAFFRSAAAKWQSIIVGDVPSTSGTIPPRSCGKGFATPSFKGTIDDVLIDVLLQPIDGPGAVLGASGPCLMRSEDFLPAYGLMFFDTADLAFLEDLGILDQVVAHEMGHVLGIGSLWDFGRNLLQGTAEDPRFVGPAGIASYLDVGGRGISVPVEEDGGRATALGHWDEETFDEELMTGFFSLGKENPLSIMTIGSMQDLGYAVSTAPAEKYQVSGRQERVAGDVSGERIDLGRREKLIKPTAVFP
jgi:hypothetical protein